MKIFTKDDIPEEKCQDELFYHCVWFGKYYPHHVLSIGSILATQSNPKVIVWTDNESLEELKKIEEIFCNYKDKVVVKSGIGIIQDCVQYLQITFRSDKWRYEILSKYGGVYFDLDMLFLKDLSWCKSKNICFVQEGFSSEKVFNTALAYYPPNHKDILEINKNFGTNYLGWSELFKYQKYDDNLECVLLDNKLTDIGWCGVNSVGWDSFFDNPFVTEDCMWDSIVFHWHNRYSKQIRDGTIAGHYWKKFIKSNPLIDQSNPNLAF